MDHVGGLVPKRALERGEERAFREIVDHYGADACACSPTRCSGDAEQMNDALQDTLSRPTGRGLVFAPVRPSAPGLPHLLSCLP